MNKKQPSIWLQVTAGQGPKECGWVVAQVTQRILQEAEAADIEATLVESLAYDKMLRNQTLVAPEAFRSVLIKLEGEGIGKFVKTWCGSVKWQGESAYRDKHKRVNWFVGVVQLMPHALKAVDEHQLEKDVVIETMRSSGPGGQHVNKTSSAVRVTHQPSGIQVRVDSDRSQHRNKALALERLKMILAEDIQQEAKQQMKDRWMNHYQVSRGNPVRIFAGADFKEKRL